MVNYRYAFTKYFWVSGQSRIRETDSGKLGKKEVPFFHCLFSLRLEQFPGKARWDSQEPADFFPCISGPKVKRGRRIAWPLPISGDFTTARLWKKSGSRNAGA